MTVEVDIDTDDVMEQLGLDDLIEELERRDSFSLKKFLIGIFRMREHAGNGDILEKVKNRIELE